MKLLTYVKRFRMEASVRCQQPVLLRAPFILVPWNPDAAEDHAKIKFLSFKDTLDSKIFPNLARRLGCSAVMMAIVDNPGFIAEATWLIYHNDLPCGCIQGIRTGIHHGEIQNLAVLPEYREKGIGRALLQSALNGFYQHGIRTVQLEVCAKNSIAVRLYHETEFRTIKTLYREVCESPDDYFI